MKYKNLFKKFNLLFFINALSVLSLFCSVNSSAQILQPANLDARALTPSRVDLTWDVTGGGSAVGFLIEVRLNDSKYWGSIEELIPSNVRTYSYLFLQGGQSYQFRISAYDANYNYSAFAYSSVIMTPPGGEEGGELSRPSTVITEPLTDASGGLFAPFNLVADGSSSTEIDLFWDVVAQRIDGFQIERRQVDTRPFSVIAVVTSSDIAYKDMGLLPGTQYEYRIRAFKGEDFSDYSNIATGKTARLGIEGTSGILAPFNLKTDPISSTRIDLEWHSELQIIDGFQIERRTNGTKNFRLIATVNSNQETYTDEGLIPGIKYDYRVRAFKGNEYSEYSNISTSKTFGIGNTANPGNNSDLMGSGVVPNSFDIFQNYPNPFNPVTKIKFAVPENVSGLVKLTVYNTLGETISTLVNQQMNAGYYEVDFDGSNLSSGIYFYKLEASDLVITKKMILTK